MDQTNTSTATKKKVALHTLGCRLNTSETGIIAQGFKDRGYEIVPFGETADVVFINTCTVTDKADSTCRNLIRRGHESSPDGKIVVAGCYAQMESQTIAKMQGVDLVLGNADKYKVFEYLDYENQNKIKVDKSNGFFGAATSEGDGHTRAFLKIQDGCNYICAFCIIPFARGRSRAISIKDALKEAKGLVSKGFKEIILTGVNIGEYEVNSGEKLSDLVAELLLLNGLERLRLSSVEPNTITDELLEVAKSSSKFMDHFHIPLQSGCDDILKQMRRRYTVADYRKVILKILKNFPEAGIGADMIVGFPGETYENFLETYHLARELPLTHFHVFPYSKRKNTTASRMENQIPHHIKKERVHNLITLGESKLSMLAEDQIGRVNKVLFERLNSEGLWVGYTTNYLKIFVESDDDLKNKILDIKIIGATGGKLQGEIFH